MLEFNLFEGDNLSRIPINGLVNGSVGAFTKFTLALKADVTLFFLLKHVSISARLVILILIFRHFLVVSFSLDILLVILISSLVYLEARLIFFTAISSINLHTHVLVDSAVVSLLVRL